MRVVFPFLLLLFKQILEYCKIKNYIPNFYIFTKNKKPLASKNLQQKIKKPINSKTKIAYLPKNKKADPIWNRLLE